MTADFVFEKLPGFKQDLDAKIAERSGDQWRDYERAKAMMRKHVGYNAYNPAVRTSQAYEAMIAYIIEKRGL